MLLWGLFLTHADSLQQMRKVLRTIRWIVTDQGVESGLCDAVDCLDAFWHWASGRDVATSPEIKDSSYLLPLAMYIPGWNHIWSNLIRECSSQTTAWPRRLGQLRSMTKFLRVYDYRFVWSEALRRIGLHHMAEELLKPYLGCFVHWRWETLPLVVLELQRVRDICILYFAAEIFGKLEDQTLLQEVAAISHDIEFWSWLAAMAPPMKLLEKARRWGTWCACCDLDEKGPCPFRSRRLHQVCEKVDEVCKALSDHRDRLRCGTSTQLLQSTSICCSACISGLRLKFAWAFGPPYTFANVTNPPVAADILRYANNTPPAKHHRVTTFMLVHFHAGTLPVPILARQLVFYISWRVVLFQRSTCNMHFLTYDRVKSGMDRRLYTYI